MLIEAAYDEIGNMWRAARPLPLLSHTPGWRDGWALVRAWFNEYALRAGSSPMPDDQAESPSRVDWADVIHQWSHLLYDHGLTHAAMEADGVSRFLAWWRAREVTP